MLGQTDHHDIVNYYLQGIFTPNPQFIALPGSSVTDIPIPDDIQRKPPGAPKSGYAVLVPFLQQQGRAVERVLGDGNSLQLTGTQDHHLELRRVIAEFEKKKTIQYLSSFTIQLIEHHFLATFKTSEKHAFGEQMLNS